MQLSIIFAWYDFWVGFYWDRKGRTLYFLPIPTIGISIKFPAKAETKKSASSTMCACGHWIDQHEQLPGGSFCRGCNCSTYKPVNIAVRPSGSIHEPWYIYWYGREYVGDSSIWYQLPDFKRAGSSMALQLVRVLSKHRFEESQRRR